ncbi:hypothetical protein BDR06DRAFT_948861 [Suillus hirtellus]|nr:hypothetical protein BDR06DRAFT_948861 [Suillus hirtellus]
MGNRKISADFKVAAIPSGIFRLREILDCVGFSRRTFHRIKELHDESTRSEYLGRPRALDFKD